MVSKIDARQAKKRLANTRIASAAGETLESIVDKVDAAIVLSPTASTTNAIPKFSSTSGKDLTPSSIIIDASNNITGAGSITAGSLAVTTPVPLTSGGTGSATQNFVDISTAQTSIGGAKTFTTSVTTPIANVTGIMVESVSTDPTTTGAAATLAAFTTPTIRLTNASLVDLAMIPAPALSGTSITIINATGVAVNIDNLTGGTAANQILTGTSNTLSLANTASIFLVYDGTSSKWRVVGGSGSGTGLGGGSSGLSSVFQLTASELISTWTTGNNATFLGAGSIAGTFAFDTSTPLHGSSSYKFTQAAGSLNDWIVSSAQAVDLRFRGQQTFLTFPYQYNGATSDIQIILYDVTNSAIITSISDVIIGTNGSTSTAIVGAVIPLTCANIKIGFQVKVLNSGKVLSFDDIQLATGISDFSSISTTVTEAIEALTATSTFGSTNTGVPVLNITKNTKLGVIQVVSDAVNGTSFKALKDCTLNISASGVSTTSNVGIYITRNATTLTATAPNGILVRNTDIANQYGLVSTVVKLTSGDVIRMQRDSTAMTSAYELSITATADNNAIAMPISQVSSDTMSFAFKATTIDPTVDAIGTFNTYTYAINTNTATISSSAPTQATSSMNANGVQVFARAYNAASTTASPARVDIFIGKGLKSKQVDAYASTAKTTIIPYDRYSYNANLSEAGATTVYNELTGVLKIDAGQALTSSNTGRVLDGEVGSTSGYFVINASKSPSLVSFAKTVNDGRVISTAGTSIANSGDVKVTFDTTPTFQNGLTFDTTNNRFIAGVAGEYNVFSGVQFQSALYAAGNLIELKIYKNGVYYSTIAHKVIMAALTLGEGVSGSDIVRLVQNEYVEIFVANNRTAGATSLTTTTGNNFFAISKQGL